MAPKPPKVDTSAQDASLKLQKDRLEKERLEAEAEKERVATESTSEFLARRRGQRGRRSLIATSETGKGSLGGAEGLERRKALRSKPGGQAR